MSADSPRAEPLYHRPIDGGVCTAYQEADCKELFHMAVTRINANNPNIGKDEKVRGVSMRRSLEVWFSIRCTVYD